MGEIVDGDSRIKSFSLSVMRLSAYSHSLSSCLVLFNFLMMGSISLGSISSYVDVSDSCRRASRV